MRAAFVEWRHNCWAVLLRRQLSCIGLSKCDAEESTMDNKRINSNSVCSACSDNWILDLKHSSCVYTVAWSKYRCLEVCSKWIFVCGVGNLKSFAEQRQRSFSFVSKGSPGKEAGLECYSTTCLYGTLWPGRAQGHSLPHADGKLLYPWVLVGQFLSWARSKLGNRRALCHLSMPDV